MTKLKLCECGERAIPHIFYNVQGKRCRIHCEKCDKHTPHFATEAEAIAAWNTPADEPAKLKKIIAMLPHSEAAQLTGTDCGGANDKCPKCLLQALITTPDCADEPAGDNENTERYIERLENLSVMRRKHIATLHTRIEALETEAAGNLGRNTRLAIEKNKLNARIEELEGVIQQRPICPDCRDQCLEKATKHFEAQLATARKESIECLELTAKYEAQLATAQGEVERLRGALDMIVKFVEQEKDCDIECPHFHGNCGIDIDTGNCCRKIATQALESTPAEQTKGDSE